MDSIEAMDREVIIERAEAVRFWLLGLKLSTRAMSAIQRELGAIIADDPGGYINGQRPLAGLTIAAFSAELYRPNGGAVGRVKSVGEVVLSELRAAIPATTTSAPRPPAPPPTPALSAPEIVAAPPTPALSAPEIVAAPPTPALSVPEIVAAPPTPALSVPEIVAAPPTPALSVPEIVAAPVESPAQADVEPPVRRGPGRPKGSTKAAQNGTADVEPLVRRGPGRPKGSAKAAQNGTADAQTALAAPVSAELSPAVEKPRRGRPRRVDAPPAANIDAPKILAAHTVVSIMPEARELAPTPAEFHSVQAAHESDDPMLSQIVRLWPALHPHARRAVVMYASALWAEVTRKG